MEKFKEKYNQQPNKGIQANKTLEEYLKSKETVADTIKQADQRLTEKENQRREQERQAQAAAEAARRMEMELRKHEWIPPKELRQMFERMEAENRRLFEELHRERIGKQKEEAQKIQEEQRRAMAEQE